MIEIIKVIAELVNKYREGFTEISYGFIIYFVSVY